MAVIPENDERYLRQILLLGNGGCLVLRGLIERERNKDGRSLEDILRSVKPKLQNRLEKFQFKHVFPTNTFVNADTETWDISLLTGIILTVFGHVTQGEKDAIAKIRKIRNTVQGHHPAYSLAEGEYDELQLELSEQLLQLSTGLGKDTKIKCLKIITYTGAGSFSGDLVLKVLNDLHAFEPDQLSFLNERFGESKSKLDRDEEILRLTKGILRLNINAAAGTTEKELQTIIEAKCDDREKKEKALDVLFKFVKLIQNQDNFSEHEIRHIIEQRIRYYGSICLRLIDDLLSWFTDICKNPNAMPGTAQLGSIRIPIWCSLMEGVLKHMEYMDSENCKERLSEISYSLSNILGFPCSLSWTVVPASLQNVTLTLPEHLKASSATSETRKIVLPFHIKSLEGDEVKDHLTRVSETLSTIVGANINLASSVVQDQFTHVDEISKDTGSGSVDKDVDTLKNSLDKEETKKSTDESDLEAVYSGIVDRDPPRPNTTPLTVNPSPGIRGSRARLVENIDGAVGGFLYREPHRPKAHSLTDIPWRDMKGNWTHSFSDKLLMDIQKVDPGSHCVKSPSLLLLGPFNAGKSSFINSICGIGKGRLVNKAYTGSSAKSFAVFRGTGLLRNFRLFDTTGVDWVKEEEVFHVGDVVHLIEGHMRDTYKFNIRQPLTKTSPHYNPKPKAKEKTHCVIFVIDALVISSGSIPNDMKNKIMRLQEEIKLRNIPRVVVLTKVDLLCDKVADDIGNIFRSTKVKKAVKRASGIFAIPESNIHPVKNYEGEIDIDPMINIPLLLALRQIIHFALDYLESIDEDTDSD